MSRPNYDADEVEGVPLARGVLSNWGTRRARGLYGYACASFRLDSLRKKPCTRWKKDARGRNMNGQ